MNFITTIMFCDCKVAAPMLLNSVLKKLPWQRGNFTVNVMLSNSFETFFFIPIDCVPTILFWMVPVGYWKHSNCACKVSELYKVVKSFNSVTVWDANIVANFALVLSIRKTGDRGECRKNSFHNTVTSAYSLLSKLSPLCFKVCCWIT